MKLAVTGICFVVLTEKGNFFVTAKQLHLKETQQAFVNFLCSVADQMGKTPNFHSGYFIIYPTTLVCPHLSHWPSIIR